MYHFNNLCPFERGKKKERKKEMRKKNQWNERLLRNKSLKNK